MRTRLLAAALVVAALPALTAVAASTTGRTDATRPVSHAGRWITQADGRVVIDHGFNVVSKLAPYDPRGNGFGTDDARFLAAHGFTAVRLGVILNRLEPAPGKFDDGYLRSIAATVHLLGRHGIRSLLDFHQDLFNEKYGGEGLPAWMALDDGLPPQPQAGFPGSYFAMPALWRAFDNLWADAGGPGGVGLRTRYAQASAHLAQFFRGNADVLGYDMFNEPWPGSDYLSCFPPRGCPETDQQRLAPLMRASIDAIHRVDPGHLAFYEPWLMFGYGAPTGLGDFADGNSGFSFHDYCLATVGVPETPPTRLVCDQFVETPTIDNALAQANVGGDALMLTEFGATSNVTELQEMLRLADGHAIPWLEWAYCACGDPTGSGEAEALVLDPRKPPTGANVNRTTLAALDVPHPTLVAGTPGSYGYDPDTRVFTFTYSTKAAGGHLADGLATRVWVGGLHYPKGYRATVQGARITSAPNARVLTLVAKAGLRTVTVTVRPAS